MIRASFVTEGTSDRALLPILRWLMGRAWPQPAEVVWADLRGLACRPKTLPEKIQSALALYPCEILFVHRDSDNRSPDQRIDEIKAAANEARILIPVVPVRMQEAWLLFDEPALRRAAGKPTGRSPLNLPKLAQVEQLADPKARLHDCLRAASETTGRRAKRFNAHEAVHRMASLIEDWSPLETLSAFQRLERDLIGALSRIALQGPAQPHS